MGCGTGSVVLELQRLEWKFVSLRPEEIDSETVSNQMLCLKRQDWDFLSRKWKLLPTYGIFSIGDIFIFDLTCIYIIT